MGTEHQLEELMKDADRDGDGSVDFDEFVVMFLKWKEDMKKRVMEADHLAHASEEKKQEKPQAVPAKEVEREAPVQNEPKTEGTPETVPAKEADREVSAQVPSEVQEQK